MIKDHSFSNSVLKYVLKLSFSYKHTDRNGANDKSMTVSMEINGIIYQGVLFAQHSGGLRA